MDHKSALTPMLACPACSHRPPLAETEGGWICRQCNREYPIIDGIPHLVIKEGLTPSPNQQTRS